MARLSKAILIGVALVGAFAPLPQAAVERLYSRSFYLALQPHVTGLSNTVSFSLLDVLVVAVAAAWIAATAIDISRHLSWRRVISGLVVRSVVWASALYVVFLLLWGLNYRRVPLAEKLQFDASAVSAEGARALAGLTVERVNALYGEAHAEGWLPAGTIDPKLEQAFARTERALGAARLALPARPKRTVLDLYFRRAGVDGMTDPYFLETLVSSGLLPFERPLVVAHEWGHLAGYADEGEASFVGWLACLQGTSADRYSGWLFLYGEMAAASADRRELESRLAAGPREDLRAIADRIRREVDRTVLRIGWRVYDRYLKANRVSAGVSSYADVVRLALGVRFAADGTPLLR
jgi:hypothetical protein